jgi:DNA-binding transcriptional LysR family regulator
MRQANLNRLEYFVAIAEAGTITAAAERLRISKAVVSKQLQLLEAELGTALVVRNSRHLRLTGTGQSFYEAARASVAQAEEAYAMVQQGRSAPAGNLRITAPLDLGISYVAPVVAAFRAEYPAVTVDLTLSDARLDPVESRFDISYRVGWLADSANVARKLADFQQVAVAAPGFAEAHGMPGQPQDLAPLPFVEHRALARPLSWRFAQAGGSSVEAEMRPALSADVTPAIKAMIQAGAGFSILPDFFVREEMARGTLVRLLPQWQLPSGGIYAVYPPTPYRSAAVQKFAEQFAGHLRAALSQDQAAAPLPKVSRKQAP